MCRSRDRIWVLTMGLLLAPACGGSSVNDGGSPTKSPGGSAREPTLPGAFAQPRVGNQDPRGAGQQPDYDAAASSLRERFEPMFRADGVPAPRDACAAMLDAARQYYAEAIEEPGERQAAVAQLDATRSENEASCLKQTSPRAATCAATLLREREGELAWALDQCSRAFRAAAPPG